MWPAECAGALAVTPKLRLLSLDSGSYPLKLAQIDPLLSSDAGFASRVEALHLKICGFGAATLVLGLLVIGSQFIARLRRRRDGVNAE